MSLKQWEANGWLRPHQASPLEIQKLLRIVDRDIDDSRSPVSADWRFGIAYNAGLKLATILLYAEGYRAGRSLEHYRTIQAIPEILGIDHREKAIYLDSCRRKRNVVEYEEPGAATESDYKELLEFVLEFKRIVLEWLTLYHPELATALDR